MSISNPSNLSNLSPIKKREYGYSYGVYIKVGCLRLLGCLGCLKGRLEVA
jgi:hypothetical protein